MLKAVSWNESESKSSHRYVALQEEFTFEGIREPGKWSISHLPFFSGISRGWCSTRMRKPKEQGTVRHCA